MIVLRPPETLDGKAVQLPYLPVKIDSISFYPALSFGEQLDKGSYGRIVKSQRALYLFQEEFIRVQDFSEIVCKINDIEIDEDEADSPKAEEYYAEEIHAVLHEAILHALASHVMKLRGFPTIIPTLYEVFAISPKRAIEVPSDIHSIVLGMEFVEGETLHKYMQREIVSTKINKDILRNDRFLIDILIQLTIYL